VQTAEAAAAPEASSVQQAITSPHTASPASLRALGAAAGNAAVQRKVSAGTQPPMLPVSEPTPAPAPASPSMERTFGAGFEGVQVSNGASAPAMGAAAYTQGDAIGAGAGAPAGLIGHEAWHVTQQRQGRVQPTTSVNGAAINDNAGLEREADVMGARALGNVAAQRLAETDEEVPSTFNMPGVNLPAPGGGNALPPEVRAKMEGAFGHDFSDVRVHTGGAAASVGALAYTQGSDIHFQPGQYNPGTLSGQETIGHELAHVVQQRAGAVATPQGLGAPVNADPSLEAEADALGRQAAHADGAMAAAAPASFAPSAGVEGPVQGLGIFDRIKSWFGGGKKDEAPAGGDIEMGPVGGAVNPLAAAAAPPPVMSPAESPRAAADIDGGDADADVDPEGAAIVVDALPPDQISAAADEARKLGPNAAEVIASAADGPTVTSNDASAPSAGDAMGDVPGNPRDLADELGVGDAFADLDIGDALPGTGTAIWEGIKGGASVAGSAISSAASSVGGAAMSAGRAVYDDPLTAGAGAGAAVSGGIAAAGATAKGISTVAGLGGSGIDHAAKLFGAASPGYGGASVNTGWADAGAAVDTAQYAGGAGGVFGAASSLRDVYGAGSELASSNQALTTDTETGTRGLSALSAAAQSSASAARSIEAARLGVNASQNVGNAVMAGAGTAAAGLSIATGSIDVIRGVGGAALAQSRMGELRTVAGLSDREGVKDQARYAAGKQEQKRDDRLITAGKGALGVIGGGLLLGLGLTNPVGLALITGAALIGGGVALYRWWQGRKKVKDASGQETNVTVKQQEQADRAARAAELFANKDDREYRKILLAIGISEKKLASGAVTPADIEKALAPR